MPAKTKQTVDHKFPKTLYVTRETDNQGDTIGLGTAYAIEDIDADEDGNAIGVYELVDVRTLRVNWKLEPDH